MNESSMYSAQVKKLQGICEEYDLLAFLKKETYPITLTIKPNTNVDTQMSMLEDVENKGYISPDAFIQFCYEPGHIRRKYGGQFTITDTLQGKIENIFKKLCLFWLQFFFMDIITNQRLGKYDMPYIDRTIEDADPLESYDEDDDMPEPFDGDEE